MPRGSESHPTAAHATPALLAACVAAAATAPAQEAATDAANPFGRKYPPRVYQTVRVQGEPPAIDGRLDDAAWARGTWSGDYIQHLPDEGAEPTHPTELNIVYDDDNVYFAIRVFDDPRLVHRYPGRRDAFTGDMVGIAFDSYNDKRTGFEFDMTAGGSKIDLILGNGEFEWDTTWDAVWDGAVAHDDQGWAAEFRIPLSQLRYGDQPEQVWGLHAWRWIDRLQEESQWQLIPRQNTGRMYNLGELHGIRDLPRSRNLELLPYAAGRTAPGDAADAQSGTAVTGGLDLKLSVKTNFTLDATVNPDFGQVEADPSVVNLTAFETFFQEKRPFFLEGRKILSFDLEGFDQLFYSRRIGQAPPLTPALGAQEKLDSAETSSTILGAVKLTGKTAGGLSVGVLQSFSQAESVRIRSPSGLREVAVAPTTGYSVARLHKDWGQGTTSLGGMLTSTRRWTSEPSLAFLSTQATTAGLGVSHHFANRTWLAEASGVMSHVTGGAEAIGALQSSPVHFYQRPDAEHLSFDEAATSLTGFGGSLRVGRSESGRFRLTDRVFAYSPGLELNDLGFLRQADLVGHELSVGWAEAAPRGIFRQYAFSAARRDEWDFGGLATSSLTQLEASARFLNRWDATAAFVFDQRVDTRALRGGPALRLHDELRASLSAATDPGRRVSGWAGVTRMWSPEDDSRSTRIAAGVNVRPSNRLTLSAELSQESRLEALQYLATAQAGDGPRWVLGEIDQDTWSLTVRADLSITPELTLQYYGSPFVATGRYRAFKAATDTLAERYQDRFHLYAADEISYDPAGDRYRVSERGGARYDFANPDFSFRQFRSNLVLRWEYLPGSTLYAVWSQGRTGASPIWEPSFRSNWDALWNLPADDVFLIKLSYWFSP